MPPTGDIKDALAQLRERYLATSGNTVAAFSALADQLERSPDAAGVIESLRRELHRVRGTAGSYGFHETSRLAAALEPVVHTWAADRDLDRGRRAGIVRRFVQALQASLTTAALPDADAEGAGRARLLLVDVPEAAAARIASEAIHRGYRVEQVTSDALPKVIGREPDAVVVAGPSASVAVGDQVPVVALRDGDGPAARPSANVTVVDAALDARDLLTTIETRAPRMALVGTTVLVVEDDPAMSDLVRVLAEQHGMLVETAAQSEGLEAVLQRVRPAAVLLDINLPGESGIEATRRLRATPDHRELPIILFSATTDVATRSAAFAAGADDFQSKPVAPEELLRRIERVLETRRQRLSALGVHPVTGLTLPTRTANEMDAALSSRAAAAGSAALAVLRPQEAIDGALPTAAWHRTLQSLGAALAAEGARVGLVDEVAAAVLMPLEATALRERLAALIPAEGEPAWSAGVAELRPGASPSFAQLLRLAEEAWHMGREANERVHVWDPGDSGVAPDVVVVEDDDALADLVAFALSARGLTFIRFADGPAALRAMVAMRTQGRAPIVLLDVDLPGLDGFSLFERLRVERPGAFRVVFVTVHSTEAEQLRAIRAGALDYLTKPVSLRVLMAKIASWRSGTPAG